MPGVLTGTAGAEPLSLECAVESPGGHVNSGTWAPAGDMEALQVAN